MTDTKKQVDPVPEEFNSYEEAAEFWDTHDTTDYPDLFETVEVDVELRKRRYEIEVEEEIIERLRERAKSLGMTLDHLANDILRQEVMPGG